MAGSSLNNEGKVHLGYVYAADRSLATASLMIDGALSFEQCLRRWLGDDVDHLSTSVPFNYAVHRDSLLRPDEFKAHLLRVTDIAKARMARSGWSYFGRDPGVAPRPVPMSSLRARYKDSIVAGYGTEEIAIDPEQLARVVSRRVRIDPDITVFHNVAIGEVEGSPDGWLLRGRGTDGSGELEGYELVFNASWTDLIRIDRHLDTSIDDQWSLRLKYFVLRQLGCIDSLPSTTIVTGAFGDVVNYGGSSKLYLSWYPTGMKKWADALASVCDPADLSAHETLDLVAAIESGILTIVPALPAGADIVRGGWILARGTTDVSDPASRLHQRSHIGVRQLVPGYFSVNTGKLTTAPLFAVQAASAAMALDD